MFILVIPVPCEEFTSFFIPSEDMGYLPYTYGFHSWPNKIKSNKWHQNCFFLKIKMINFEVINVLFYSIMFYTVPLRQQLHVHMYNFVVSQNRRKWGMQVHCGGGWSSLRKQKGIVKSSCILTKWKQTF